MFSYFKSLGIALVWVYIVSEKEWIVIFIF